MGGIGRGYHIIGSGRVCIQAISQGATVMADGKIALKVTRFIAGFILECVMLFMIFMGVDISLIVLALPFGLMGYDAPDLFKQVTSRK